MAIVYFPFNSVITDGKPDRAANAETLARYLKTFFTDGVVLHTSDALQVYAKGDMGVQIKPGTMFIDGRILHSNAIEEISLQPASSLLHRIDRIVVRLDNTNRLMEFAVLTGEESTQPNPPALTRSGDVYEMCLAEITVSATATMITQASIADKRASNELCGIVAAVITQISTQTFYDQYTAQFAELYSEADDGLQEQLLQFRGEFDEWFENCKNIVDGATLAGVQEQIDNMKKTTVAYMLAANKWNQGEKTYNFETDYPAASFDLSVEPDSTCTEEQLDAWSGARIVGSSAGNVIKAYGDVPLIDIPVILEVSKK